MTRMRRSLLVLLAVALCSAAVFLAMRKVGLTHGNGDVKWATPFVERDLEQIEKDTLRVIVLEDPLTWEVRPKAISGVEYDLLRRFAKAIGVEVKFEAFAHPDSMILALQEGRGDLIAAQIVARKDLGRYVSFSGPYRAVRPVLAVLRADPVPMEAKGRAVIRNAVDTIFISQWSPFAAPGYHFDMKGTTPVQVHDEAMITPEDLLMEVVIGKHRAAVVTDARASHESGRFPVLEFQPLKGPDQKLCFALRKNAPDLKKRLNRWLKEEGTIEANEMIMKAYTSKVKEPGPLLIKWRIPVSGDSISPYDAHFQRYADDSGWDWELLAALAYKESRFDSNAVSHMGAQGLMQIMPATALRLGLDSSMLVGDHIAAAARFLNKLDTLWLREVPEKQQRLRFMLASYNAGPGHVIDAQRLAEQLGLDPKQWTHNVERAILLLSKPRYYMDPTLRNGYCKGSEVFHYVRDVEAMYQQLKRRPHEIAHLSDGMLVTDSMEHWALEDQR